MAASERVSPLAALREDLQGYLEPDMPFARRVQRFLYKGEIWLLCLLRWGQWLHHDCPRPLALPLKLLWRPWYSIVSTLFDTHLSEVGTFGPGLFISHTGGIWVNPNARVGAYCHIGQGAVIGAAGEARTDQFAPTIGDRVWIGPHAVITGVAVVGNDCVIGANSLVVSDVPDRGFVLGVPARLLGYSGSGRLIRRGGAGSSTASGRAGAPEATGSSGAPGGGS
jgi:serine O-acetyltransferase